MAYGARLESVLGVKALTSSNLVSSALNGVDPLIGDRRRSRLPPAPLRYEVNQGG